jgi:hypothetical protein
MGAAALAGSLIENVVPVIGSPVADLPLDCSAGTGLGGRLTLGWPTDEPEICRRESRVSAWSVGGSVEACGFWACSHSVLSHRYAPDAAITKSDRAISFMDARLSRTECLTWRGHIWTAVTAISQDQPDNRLSAARAQCLALQPPLPSFIPAIPVRPLVLSGIAQHRRTKGRRGGSSLDHNRAYWLASADKMLMLRRMAVIVANQSIGSGLRATALTGPFEEILKLKGFSIRVTSVHRLPRSTRLG